MLTWVIARRLGRRMGALAALTPVAVAVLFAFALNVFLDEQSLTGEQEAQLLPGRFEASISRLGAVIPPGSTTTQAVQADLDRAGADVVVSLQVPDFPLFTLAADGIYYREMPWSPPPFPDKLDLRTGAWPQRPGEVVISGPASAEVDLGQTFAVLDQAEPLVVVGLADNVLSDDSEVLAAPGTWASLKSTDSDLSGLTASHTYFLGDPPTADVLTTLAETIVDADLTPSREDGTEQLSAELESAALTRDDARAEAKEPWTSRSPTSFWVPVSLISPLAVVLSFMAAMRRLGPAARAMTRQGVARRQAVTGPWLAMLGWVLLSVLVAATVGSGLGHLVAQLGAGDWSAVGASWRFPQAAFTAVGIGVLIGVAAGWMLLWSATGAPHPGQVRWRPSALFVRHLRHAALTAAGCAVVFFVAGLDTSGDVIRLAALTSLAAALATPDLLRALAPRLPDGSLTARLTSRLMIRHVTRAGVTAATIAFTVAASTGLMTMVSSALEGDLLTRPAIALPGQVALDNDSTPSMPVPSDVVAAAETVPALARQQPAQLYSIGRVEYLKEYGITDLVDSVGVADRIGQVFAFDSADDVARALGRTLNSDEVGILDEGGLLVLDESLVAATGQVTLLAESDQRPVATLEARFAPHDPLPWFAATHGVVLTQTARDYGLPLSPGARIYTGVSDDDAAAVIAALSERGINPENAEVFRPPDPIVPPAALVGSSVGLFLLLLLLTASATRSQVVAMRPWASRLAQLGVRPRWARGVLFRQYGWILAVAIPMGSIAGVLPLLLSKALLPDLVVVVPWAMILVLMGALLAAVGAACWFSTRALDSRVALGWTDLGE